MSKIPIYLSITAAAVLVGCIAFSAYHVKVLNDPLFVLDNDSKCPTCLYEFHSEPLKLANQGKMIPCPDCGSEETLLEIKEEYNKHHAHDSSNGGAWKFLTN